MIAAASTLGKEPGQARLIVDLGGLDLASGQVPQRVLRYGEADNVFLTIKSQLAKDGKLKPEFEACRYCTSDPMRMAVDAGGTRRMLLAGQQDYEAEIRRGLVFEDASADTGIRFAPDSKHLELDLQGNELVVLEF